MKVIYIIKIAFLLSSSFVFPVQVLAQEHAKENSLSALIDATSKVKIILKIKKNTVKL
tara:strand:- start:428 stop:601 length:174 start_codon:yes stop_codon:yes gene_type:complete